MPHVGTPLDCIDYIVQVLVQCNQYDQLPNVTALDDIYSLDE